MEAGDRVNSRPPAFRDYNRLTTRSAKPNVKETKLAITFEKATKGWLPNKTARTILANAYGDEIEVLIGKRVQLLTTKVTVRGELKDSIIVKPLDNGEAPRAVISPEVNDRTPF